MKQKKATTTVDNIQSEHLVPPHAVVNKLVDILIGSWQPTPSEQESLAMHLSECADCRVAFSILLLIRGEYEAKEEHSERFLQDLSLQFITLHEQIESYKFELLGAYTEKMATEGKDRADKCFPILAEYVRRCPDCQIELEHTLDFLRQVAANKQSN